MTDLLRAGVKAVAIGGVLLLAVLAVSLYAASRVGQTSQGAPSERRALRQRR